MAVPCLKQFCRMLFLSPMCVVELLLPWTVHLPCRAVQELSNSIKLHYNIIHDIVYLIYTTWHIYASAAQINWQYIQHCMCELTTLPPPHDAMLEMRCMAYAAYTEKVLVHWTTLPLDLWTNIENAVISWTNMGRVLLGRNYCHVVIWLLEFVVW